MTDYEEYKQTNMLGSYQPERALLRKTDDGVQPVFRDAAYYYDEDAVVVERDMMVGKHCFHVTSIFPSQPTATATKRHDILPRGTVKVGTAVAVVRHEYGVLESVVGGVLLQIAALVDDAVAVTGVVILLT